MDDAIFTSINVPQERCELCSRVLSSNEEAGALSQKGRSYQVCCKICGETVNDTSGDRIFSAIVDAAAIKMSGSAAYRWMKAAVARQASDLFLSVGKPPTLKVFNEFIPLQPGPLDAAGIERVLDEMIPGEKLAQFRAGGDVDAGITVEGLGRFRVNVFRQLHGNSLALRPLPARVPTMDELLLPQVLRELSHLSHGLILITGPTGCGKSTTLACLIDMIDQRDQKHIITIEDPIEYIIPSRRALIHQREIGTHVASFSDGLRSALREHPDVIVVGELRDLESISLAVRAAETGHLVLGTLHSGSTVQAITRLTDVFDSNHQPQIRIQLSQSIQAVISQHLFRRQDKPGMAVATEVMIATLAIRTLIRENRIQEIRGFIDSGIREQMHTLKQSIEQRIREGILNEQCLADLNESPVHELKDSEMGAIGFNSQYTGKKK